MEVTRFRQFINGVLVPDRVELGDYVDMNRNGNINPLDLTRFRRMVYGVLTATRAWAFETANHSQP